MKRLTAVSFALIMAWLMAGCEESQLLGPSTGIDETGQSDGSAFTGQYQDQNSDLSESQEIEITEFDFSDLSYECTSDNIFPNPYNSMTFQESPRWAVCWKGNIIGMADQVILPFDTRYYSPDTLHTTIIQLPEPVDTAGISTANIRPRRGTSDYRSILTAYDGQGNEIARAVNDSYYRDPSTNLYHATLLTVTRTAGSRIHSIGITTYQNATYLDNLRLVAAIQNQDVTPPQIDYTIVTDELFPSNHKMHLALSGITASDDSGAPVVPEISIQSNENINGNGDGNTEPDWEIVKYEDGSFEVWLRAERSGGGSGRIYRVMMQATDPAGNTAQQMIQVVVPYE